MKRLVEKLNRAAVSEDATQMHLSRRSGLAQSTISDILSDKRAHPRFDHVAPLAKALDLSLDYLADDALDDPQAAAVKPDEWVLIKYFRDMKIDVHEAIKRLEAKPGAGFRGENQAVPADAARSRRKRFK